MKKIKLNSAIVLWAIVVAYSFYRLQIYSSTPGREANDRWKWPLTTEIPFSPRVPQLVIFLHPQCGCSEATASELEKIEAKVFGKVSVNVVFFDSVSKNLKWHESPLVKKVGTIPGVRIHFDRQGKEGKNFGAFTSGQTFLYSPSGELIFSGGITDSRGHEGDNNGEDAVVEYILTGQNTLNKTSVFGCSLRNPTKLITSLEVPFL